MSLKKILEEKIFESLKNFSFKNQKLNTSILEKPKNQEYGDFTSTIAFYLGKIEKKNPSEVALQIYEKVKKSLEEFSEVQVSGPYLNFKLKELALWAEVFKIDENYGKSNLKKGEKVLLEFVSANPTGPLHIGHGRWAAIGDSLARILKAVGYNVTTEFFVNNVGRQVELLAESVLAVKNGSKIPEEGYHGKYIQEIAKKVSSCDLENIKKEALFLLLENQKKVLEKFRVKFDNFFFEDELHKTGEVKKTLKWLEENGYTYKKDGAVWLKTAEISDDKDRVLVREEGTPTYFLSDIAYHWNKIKRNYHQLINVFGADHHNYMERLRVAFDLLPEKNKPVLKIIIGQLVSLFRGGQPARMSKRTGDLVTLEEVIDEIGVDATRYLLVRNSPNIHLDFDLEEAKKKTEENPVYYVQYAHARICSIFEKLKEKAIKLPVIPQKISYQFNNYERNLMKKLILWPDELEESSENLEPYRLTRFAEELAEIFHVFYHNCQVLDEKNLQKTAIRLKLTEATRYVLALILDLLGVTAPQKM